MLTLKRPMAVIGITYLVSQLIAVAVGTAISAVLGVLSAVFAALSFVLFSDKHRRIILPVLVSCAVAFGAYSIYCAAKLEPAQLLYGQTIYIQGEIVQEPYSAYGRYYYVVDTDYIESTEDIQKTRIRISASAPLEAEVSDIFEGVVTVNAPESTENFSAEASRRAKGIILTAYISYGNEPEISQGKHNIRYHISQIRQGINSRINLLLDGDLAGLLKGILLGDKSDISNELINDFRICGLSHLLAVSGLHMSIIVCIMTVILRHFGIAYRPLAAILLAFIWFYMALTGFSYSVLRAGLMTSLMLLARVLNREADSLNSFGTALLIICFFNPYAAADAGLLLSASSSLGLITLSSRVQRRVDGFIANRINDRTGIIKAIMSAIVPSMVATACAAPVIMLYFGEYSIISPLANLLCVQLSNVFMISGALAVVVSFIPFFGKILADIIIIAAWISGKLLEWISGTLGDIPNASISVNFSFLPLFFCCAASMLIVCYILTLGSKDRIRSFFICTAIIGAVFFIGVSADYLVKKDDHHVTIYEVEDGIAVAAFSGYDCVVVGTGGDRYLAWEMSVDIQEQNISRVDALFYPSSSDVFTSYAEEFIGDITPEKVFIPSSCTESDDIIYAVRNIQDSVYDIADAEYCNRSETLKVNTFTDSDGNVWVNVICGQLRVLICPENGNCSLLPEEMKNPWCAVMLSDEIVNLWALNPAVIIVSADSDDCAKAEALLRYRGADEVYTTAKGNVTISEYGAGMLIGDE